MKTIIYLYLFIIFTILADKTYAQCGSDGKQPCPATQTLPMETTENNMIKQLPPIAEIDCFGLNGNPLKVQVDDFFSSLQAHPEAKGIITVEGTKRAVINRIAFIRYAIAFRKYDAGRVKFVRHYTRNRKVKAVFQEIPIT